MKLLIKIWFSLFLILSICFFLYFGFLEYSLGESMYTWRGHISIIIANISLLIFLLFTLHSKCFIKKLIICLSLILGVIVIFLINFLFNFYSFSVDFNMYEYILYYFIIIIFIAYDF